MRNPNFGVVVHPRAYAVAASADGVVMVTGPFVGKPLISTGAGDHFNAGFCLGKLLGQTMKSRCNWAWAPPAITCAPQEPERRRIGRLFAVTVGMRLSSIKTGISSA